MRRAVGIALVLVVLACGSEEPGPGGGAGGSGGTGGGGAGGTGGAPCVPADETCNDRDDDCDGEVDEGLGVRTCQARACVWEIPSCFEGTASSCDEPPSRETACGNGEDDDCDTLTDCDDPDCTAATPIAERAGWATVVPRGDGFAAAISSITQPGNVAVTELLSIRGDGEVIGTGTAPEGSNAPHLFDTDGGSFAAISDVTTDGRYVSPQLLRWSSRSATAEVTPIAMPGLDDHPFQVAHAAAVPGGGFLLVSRGAARMTAQFTWHLGWLDAAGAVDDGFFTLDPRGATWLAAVPVPGGALVFGFREGEVQVFRVDRAGAQGASTVLASGQGVLSVKGWQPIHVEPLADGGFVIGVELSTGFRLVRVDADGNKVRELASPRRLSDGNVSLTRHGDTLYVGACVQNGGLLFTVPATLDGALSDAHPLNFQCAYVAWAGPGALGPAAVAVNNAGALVYRDTGACGN